jgi:hypothetical protein
MCPSSARDRIAELRDNVRTVRSDLSDAQARAETLDRLRTEGTVATGVTVNADVANHTARSNLPGFWQSDGEWASLRMRLEGGHYYTVQIQSTYGMPEPAYQALRVSGSSLQSVSQEVLQDSQYHTSFSRTFYASRGGIYIIRVGSGVAWSGPISVSVNDAGAPAATTP